MSYVGQAIKRFEDVKLLTGNGLYLDDIKLTDALHVAILRSPYSHAKIRSVNSSVARDMAGVVALITAHEIKDIVKDIPARRVIAEQTVEGLNVPEHPVLARDKVCYVGQPVAAVVARVPAQARDAVESIQVDYEPLPPLLDPQQASKLDAPVIHGALGSNVAIKMRHEGGDLERAFASAKYVIRQKFQSPRLAPVPIETRGVAAHYSPGEDLLTVWNSTQAPHRVKAYLAEILGLGDQTIRVIAPDVGGSFGLKDCIFPEDVLVPWLSRLLGQPVKWVEDRQENMLAYHGRGLALDLEAAVDGNGLILGLRAAVVADLGAYFLLTTASAPVNACRRITGPYRVPALQVDLLGVITNKTPTGAYRGTGGPESAFAMERTMDLIAKEVGRDPADVRKMNFVPDDAFPYETCTGITYDSGHYASGFDRALGLIQYPMWRERAEQRKPGDPLIGVGLAAVLKASGASGDHRVESARLNFGPSGEVVAYTGISPHGQGSETAFAQIVADHLGLDPSLVRVVHGDTNVVPFGEGTSASRGLIVGGSALFSVALEARIKLSSVASQLLGCAPEEIDFQNGKVFIRGKPGAGISLGEVVSAAHNFELLPQGLEFTSTYTLPANPYTFAAHAAVVEVDEDTGDVKIVQYAGVHDCGHVINPALVDGQIHGGIAQGIGQALTEQMAYSPEGQPLTASLLDYAVPYADGVPPIVLDMVPAPSPTNPLGAKGIGSVGTVPAPVAVANAVLDALSDFGVRHLDTPLTPEKVWRAMRQGRG